ncbi:flavin reductase family protein [Actinomycetospora termitidis]|uniref:flavin reductase family protein n=1 Tax=Actinomycetospora termitidis TaxID=3053470 RepID=UPI003CE5AB58
MAHTSTTWPRLRTAAGLAVSVLAEDHAQLARRLAGPGQDRFIGTTITPGGLRGRPERQRLRLVRLLGRDHCRRPPPAV